MWVDDKQGSLLFRAHRRVLKESRAEPFFTIVDCDYPNPETSGETFLDGVGSSNIISRTLQRSRV